MTFPYTFEALHEHAVKATGLDDFGTTDYVEPMQLLLADYNTYCKFSPLGEQMSFGWLLGLLVSRLHAQQGFKAHPDFAAAPVEKPIIVVGMPRTGSTTLHRLLAQDPGTQCLVPWLGNTPLPRPPRDTWESHPLYQATVQGFAQFYQLVPEVQGMHPMVADQADECRYGLEPSFWSPGLAFVGPDKGKYAQWLVSTDPSYAYRHYRKVLGLIAGGDRRRWILKDPTTHSWAPRTMLEAFPDALFVYTHREPVTAISSVADMLYYPRRMRMDGLTHEQNGRDQLAFWGPAVEKMDALMNELGPSRVVDLHVRELHADPLGAAEKIYRHFGIPVTEEARASWCRFVETDPRGGHGAHHYQTESLGFGKEDVYATMTNYCRSYAKRYEAGA